MDELRSRIEKGFPKAKCSFYCNDANVFLQQDLRIILNAKKDRGVIFLDPFAMNVQWKSIEAIAATKCLDMWYLFPVNAVVRQLNEEGQFSSSMIKRLDDSLGGNGWHERFYKKKDFIQMSLFGEDDEQKYQRIQDSVKAIGEYAIENLRKVFPCVSSKPLALTNSNNATMFYLIFAVSNPSRKAYDLANRIANDIIKKGT